MLRQIFTGALALVASAAIVRADAKGDLKAAADKLAAAPNYSFTTDTQNAGGQGFGGGKSEGKVDKNGVTWVKTPGFGQGGGQDMEILIKGDKVLIKMQDTWQTPEEMMQATGGGQGGGGGFNFGAMIANRVKDPIGGAAKTFDKLQNLQKTDDAYTADLSPEDAKAALTQGMGGRRGGGQAPEVTNPKVSYKIWVKDGMISKLEAHTSGSMNFNGNPFDFDRTATTEIKDVGSTKVDVPADAKAKLDAPAAPAQQ